MLKTISVQVDTDEDDAQLQNAVSTTLEFNGDTEVLAVTVEATPAPDEQ